MIYENLLCPFSRKFRCRCDDVEFVATACWFVELLAKFIKYIFNIVVCWDT